MLNKMVRFGTYSGMPSVLLYYCNIIPVIFRCQYLFGQSEELHIRVSTAQSVRVLRSCGHLSAQSEQRVCRCDSDIPFEYIATQRSTDDCPRLVSVSHYPSDAHAPRKSGPLQRYEAEPEMFYFAECSDK